MGISGLHQVRALWALNLHRWVYTLPTPVEQVIKPYLRPVSLSKYRGQRVAIDGYAWLHRGACQRRSEQQAAEPHDSATHVAFCLDMLDMLQKHGVIPVVGFQ